MNYIYKYKRILLFLFILTSLICFSQTYKINITKNKTILIDLSSYSGHRFYNIYNKLEKKYAENFSLIIKSIDNNPIIVPLLVEEKSYDYFKANKSKLCKIFLTEINFFYIDSLENNQIRCIANKKNYENLNFLKFAGPVDMSIIYSEVFQYTSEDYIKLIYDL